MQELCRILHGIEQVPVEPLPLPFDPIEASSGRGIIGAADPPQLSSETEDVHITSSDDESFHNTISGDESAAPQPRARVVMQGMRQAPSSWERRVDDAATIRVPRDNEDDTVNTNRAYFNEAIAAEMEYLRQNNVVSTYVYINHTVASQEWPEERWFRRRCDQTAPNLMWPTACGYSVEMSTHADSRETFGFHMGNLENWYIGPDLGNRLTAVSYTHLTLPTKA